jgi:CHAT domain-containing protein/cytochrome c-type biogenesis protein CcmH/NrfG
MSNRFKYLSLAFLVFSVNSSVVLATTSVTATTLAQTTTNSNRKVEADRLLQQGIKQLDSKQLDVALKSLQQALSIYQQIKNRPGQGSTLKYLGNAYNAKKDNAKAIEAYQESLLIAREVQDRDLEARNLLNLGTVYNSQKNHNKALEFLQPSLQIAQEIKSSELEFKTLSQLYESYTGKGDTAKAQVYQQQLLSKFSELIKIAAIAQLSEQLPALNKQKNYQKAIETSQQALALIDKLNITPEDIKLLMTFSGGKLKAPIPPQTIKLFYQITIMGHLIDAYEGTSDYPKIITVGQQVLEVIRNFNLSEAEWSSLANLSGEKQNTSLAETKKNVEILVLYVLAKSYDISGEHEKAISFAQQSLKLARELKNQIVEANSLITLASASKSQAVSDAEHEKTLAFAQQALTIAKQIKNQDIEADALNTIADIYNDSEEYQKTIEFAEASLVIAKKSQNSSLVVKPLMTLAIAYLNLGNYQKFNQLSQEALKIAQANKQSPLFESLSLLFLTLNNFIQADYQKTITFAQKGLDFTPKLNVPYYRQQFEMLNHLLLGVGYGGLNDNQKAIDSVQKSLQIARETKNSKSEAQYSVFLAGFYRRNKQYQLAIDTYKKADEIANKLDYSGNRALVYTGLARVYRDLNQSTTAITYYQKAINDIEEVRNKNRGLSRELQASLLQVIQDADRSSIADIYREYATLLLSQGRSLEANQVLELLKVQELSEFTNNKKEGTQVKPVAQTPVEAKIIKNYGSLIAFGQKVDECQKNNCPQKTQLADERDSLIAEFSQRIQNLERDVRDRLSKDRGNLDTQDLRSVGKKIVESQPGTVLINVFVIQDKTWLLWVSKGGVVKSLEVPLGEPKMRETVNKFRKLLQNPSSDIQEVQATGKEIYDWLIKPIEPELKANKIENLVFSMDRAARYIPVSALFDGKQYLAENYNISTVLSAGLTDTESRLPKETVNTRVLALGLSNPVPGFTALPNVNSELDAIVKQNPSDKNGVFPGDKLLNQKFDYRALRDNLKNRKILHIATHGVFVPGRQDDSYLVLGTGEKLPIPKIDNLEDLSDVHLVVLSACETALGQTAKDGVEIPGISFYFLNRRAKAVMASLWLVSDRSTSELMQHFYTNLAQSNQPTKAEALRLAQLSLLYGKQVTLNDIKRGGVIVEATPGTPSRKNPTQTSFAHPYYWAPFILIGNGL